MVSLNESGSAGSAELGRQGETSVARGLTRCLELLGVIRIGRDRTSAPILSESVGWLRKKPTTCVS